MYKMIAIDLDGTMLNSYGEVTENTSKTIKKVIENNSKYTFKLFGSRAKGTFKNNSDIDLAIFENVDRKNEYKIRNEIDELDIIYKVDLVFINNNTKKELLESIKMEGVDF